MSLPKTAFRYDDIPQLGSFSKESPIIKTNNWESHQLGMSLPRNVII